ncbi:hypothetical protein KKF86_07560 [bacterium]|nr:hypothetical protein [bacterium]
MSKTVSNGLIRFWEKGYLYIAIASLIYIFWFISNNVGILDWVKEIAYFEYFKTAFNDYHTLPYFWWNILEEVAWRPPIPGTSAIIANPETALFSPFTPMLYLLSAQVYIKLYVIIQFLIGVIGLFALKRKLNWDNLQFRTFAILFLFSPIIMQHLSVAYFTWYNFYLFPWLIYFVADRRMIVSIVGSATVLGLIVLQGGIYIVQYVGLFYVLYEIFHIFLEKDWKRIIRIFMVPVLTGLFSLVRIYITGYSYGDYIRPWVEIYGYNISFFMFYALIPTVTIPPIDLFFHSNFLGWSLTPHDSGQFWGLSIIMLAFVVVKYRDIVKNANAQQQNGLNYNAVFIAASVLFIISFYKIWYLTMRAVSVLNIPLFESIKNHGIRFIMGSYFGFALLLANYSKEIWKEFHQFVKTRFWQKAKKVLENLLLTILFGTGFIVLFLRIFKRNIVSKFSEIIIAAYNNTGHLWLRNRMEGIEENSLEFYFYRFDVAYSAILHWFFVIFSVLLITFLLIYFFKKKRKLFEPMIVRFPNLKFELLLAIPLILSTAMWTNLVSSVPYESYDVLPVMPPKILMDSDVNVSPPEIEVTPSYIIIKPVDNLTVNGYIFLQIPATDYKHFDIISKNAVLFDKNGQLMLKPLDNEPIELQFHTAGVWKALILTLVSWFLAMGFMATVFIVNNRRRKI